MRTVFFLYPTKGGYSAFPRRIFNTKEETLKVKKEYESRGATVEFEERALNKGEFFWAVYIAEYGFCLTDYHAVYVKAKTESGARRKGQEYIRAWNIEDQKIQKIVQVI